MNIPKHIGLQHIRLVPCIRLRREYFGGLVYDPRNGTTLEVDKEAFHFLYLIKERTTSIDKLIKFCAENKLIKGQSPPVIKTINQLMKLDIVEKKEGIQGAHTLNYKIPPETPKYSWLSAPETVHWAVTYQCEAGCSHCYTRRFPVLARELNTHLSLKIIEKVAKWGVFQLAIGGGEPFSRKDLPELVRYAANTGLSVHITTGMYQLESGLIKSLPGSTAALNIGIPAHIFSDHFPGTGLKELIKKLKTTTAVLRDAGIVPGVNLVLTKSIIPQLMFILEQLMNIGINRVVLLRYKPPESIKQWKAAHPTLQQMKQLHIKIIALLKHFPRLTIRVDCSMSYVQRHLPLSLAAKLGIKGCVAGDRILAIAPDGSVYPCSQLVHPRCYSGNLLDYEPQILWDQSRNLRKYRSFRTKKTFTHSKCGICGVNTACGGCRVFAEDALGGDPGCPDPLTPELTQLGKTGRFVDYTGYAETREPLSVEEYMERYRVGKKTAIKEIKKFKDTHPYYDDDIIYVIQDIIGYTSGGYPLATTEEISRWIRIDSNSWGYPGWINKDTTRNKADVLIEPKQNKKISKRRKKR